MLATCQNRLSAAITKQLRFDRQRLAALAEKRVLQSPMGYVEDRRMLLDYTAKRFQTVSVRYLTDRKQRFVRLTAKLDAMSPLKVLSRGYSLIQTEAGTTLQDAAQTRIGDELKITLHHGTLRANVTEIQEETQE